MPDQFLSSPALGLQGLHFNTALTNLLIATPNGEFVASRLLPVLPVQKRSDAYFKFDPKQRMFAVSDDRRAPGTIGNVEDYGLSYDTYWCDDHALAGFVTWEEEANADAPLAPLMDKVLFLGQKTQLNEEYNLKAMLDASLTAAPLAVDGETYTIDTDDGKVHVDLYEFINQQITTIRLAIGRKPNVMVMDDKVFKAFQAHPAIVERVKYTSSPDSPAQVTKKTLAALFGLDEVLVPDCVVNTAQEGQEPVNAPLWGKDLYLAYRAPRAAMREPSLGYTITWANPSGQMGGSMPAPSGAQQYVGQGWSVEAWVKQSKKSDWVRVQKYYSQKLTMSAAGLRIPNVIQ